MYYRLGNLVFVSAEVVVTATTNLNDYILLGDNLPSVRKWHGGRWHITKNVDEEGLLSINRLTNTWFLNTQGTEFNWGQYYLDNGARYCLISLTYECND